MRFASILMLVLLLAAWVVWQGLQPQKGVQAMPAWQAPDLTGAEVIDITGPGMPKVHLVYRDRGWWLNDKAADADAVRHLLDDVQQMRPVRMVTNGHQHDTELELGAGAVVLRFFGREGRLLDTLRIGKQGADLISTYVRRENEAPVMAMDRALLWQVKRLPQSWLIPVAKKTDAKTTGK